MKQKNKRTMLSIIVIISLVSIFLYPKNSKTTYAVNNAEQISEYERLIKQKEQQLKDLQNKQKQYSQAIENKEDQIDSLKSQIDLFNKQIQSLSGKITITKTEIETTEIKIAVLNEQIREKEANIEEQKEMLSFLLNQLYENSEVSPVELLIQNQKISEVMNKIDSIDEIQSSLSEKLKTVKDLKTALEDEKKKIEAQQSQLVNLNSQLNSEKNSKQMQTLAKDDLLKRTKNSEAEYRRLLALAKQEEAKTDTAISNLILSVKRLKNEKIEPFNGYFRKPFDGSLRISSNQGCRTLFGKWQYHQGLDFSTGGVIGKPLYAIAGGKVLFHQPSPRTSDLAYAVVVHEEVEMVSLYLHVSRFNPAIRNGQTVKKGDIIAYTGGVGWGAGTSTGPHLHFEMRDLSKDSPYSVTCHGVADPIYWRDYGKVVNPKDFISF